MLIVFREKIFGKSESSLDKDMIYASDTFIKEIMKSLLLDSCPGVYASDRYHWSNLALDNMTKTRGIKLFLGLVDNYENLPRKRYTREFAIKMRHNLSTAKEYVKYIRHIIETEIKHGELKYTDALKSSPNYDEDTIIQMCKYIALCMNGQINPKQINWYDGIIKTTPINWDKPIIDKYMNSTNLQNLIEYMVGIRSVI